MQQAEQGYEKEKLNERISKLSAGVAVIQVKLQTSLVLFNITKECVGEILIESSYVIG